MPTGETNALAGEKRRREIVAFIDSFIRKHGHSPTIREVAEGVGLSSAGAAHRQMERLVEEGLLLKVHVTSHSVVYTRPS